MKTKKLIILILSLSLMFLGRFLPSFPGLTAGGSQVIYIFCGVLVLWLTTAIDWPSVLVLVALSLVPGLKTNGILSSAYGGSTFVFLMYTFILTYALSKTSILKRIAYSFIKSKLASRGPWYFISAYFASILVIGSFISPTVLFFIYLPILEEILSILKVKKGEKLGSLLMMGTVIMVAISSGMTPISHVFPVIALGLYQTTFQTLISYLSYMGAMIPTGIFTALITVFLFKIVLRPEVSSFKDLNLTSLEVLEPKINKTEKAILSVFILVVSLWILPNLMTTLLPAGNLSQFFSYLDSLGTAIPAMIGTVALCVIKIEEKPLITLKEAFSLGVPWSSLVMCAATLALGSAITNPDLGITSWITSGLSPLILKMSPALIVVFFAAWATIQTNVSSNMVTATVVTTALMALAPTLTKMSIPALTILIGSLASYAFATPPAMPSVAIATSSGWTNTWQMLKYGALVCLVSILVASLVGYPLALLLLA